MVSNINQGFGFECVPGSRIGFADLGFRCRDLGIKDLRSSCISEGVVGGVSVWRFQCHYALGI